MDDQEIIKHFNILYYVASSQTWKNTRWMGVLLQKYPTDLWNYQEMLYEIRPDLIIETGTLFGGSAYYMAHLCDMLGNGKIITIDNNSYGDDFDTTRPFHQRIKYLLGSSTDPEIIAQLEKSITPDMKVMVILDSDHRKDHVLSEMKLYSKFVTKNSYLIVEDSNINGHPVYSTFGPGPMEAIDEFLLTNNEFIIDVTREKFMLTTNPKGYLKKV
jgi:cephalosporin hydroxylase